MVDLTLIHEKTREYFNVDYFYLFTESPKRKYTYKRQVFHYIARELNKKHITFEQIGMYLSDVLKPAGHSLVLRNYRVIEGFLTYDKQVKKDVETIIKMIESHE